MPARGGGPGRRPKRGWLYAALALLAHLGLLGVMGLGLLSQDRPAAVSAIQLDLTPVDPSMFERRDAPAVATPAKTPGRVPPAPVAQRAATPPPTGPASAGPAITARPSDPDGAMGPVANNPNKSALRASVGCDNADYLGLTPAETVRCEDRDKRLRARTHATYLAIDPEKKDFFDGTCKHDDDWCLYRTGQGPYPGLLALFKKKH